MRPLTFMLIAGEPSGDLLAAELVQALRLRLHAWQSQPTDAAQPLRTNLAPRFFGAGRQQMAGAGVEILVDMTPFAVVGVSDVLKQFLPLRRAFHQLLQAAIDRKPDVIIGVDYGGFNLSFARAVRRHVRARAGVFSNWNPKLVQFVSPQVWASREERAYRMERDLDLLLSIFPFEKRWYARRTPKLRVEFVGHPMLDRQAAPPSSSVASSTAPLILLLPGSRPAELERHLPVMLAAWKMIQAKLPGARAKMIVPSEALLDQAKAQGVPPEMGIQAGGLTVALRQATLAITKTGTVTVECAFHGVPAVALYKTSWSTYQIAKRRVTVKWLTMPNLLAGAEVFPEFIQNAATPENLARAALELLTDEAQRAKVRAQLRGIVASLGEPGASRRAAGAIVELLDS